MFRLARIRGIDLMLHWSLAIIVALVAMSISSGEVPQLHPEWADAVAWTCGLAVGIGLVLSIALHELAHSLTAQRLGVPVPRITLFAFGGMAQMAARPRRAAHEFAITAVGPLTSLVLGLALLVAGQLGAADAASHPYVGALALSAHILGSINIALAVFNCLPGTPLDGGRILHSIIWRATGSERRATVVASRSGEAIGTSLAFVGAAMLFGWNAPWFGEGIGGVWLIMIGWFLASIARGERAAESLEAAAAHAPVSRLVRAVPVVNADTPLDEFADGVLLPIGQNAMPIVEGDQVVGLASMHDVLTVREAARPSTTVGAVMTPWDRVSWIDCTATILDAARRLAELKVEQLPVLDTGRVIGFVHRADVNAWLQLHREPLNTVPTSSNTQQGTTR